MPSRPHISQYHKLKLRRMFLLFLTSLFLVLLSSIIIMVFKLSISTRGFHEKRDIPSPAEHCLTPVGGPCSMELVQVVRPFTYVKECFSVCTSLRCDFSYWRVIQIVETTHCHWSYCSRTVISLVLIRCHHFQLSTNFCLRTLKGLYAGIGSKVYEPGLRPPTRRFIRFF
jgi:hypothetical protein